MDLREYQVPKNTGEIVRSIAAAGHIWYQPFVFTDKVITGTGAIWNAQQKEYFCTEEDKEEIQKAFLREALILGNFYHHLVDLIQAASGDELTSQKYLDIGCNVGHFCFDLVRRGAKDIIGVDRSPESYQVVSDVTKLRFNYVKQMYSETTHDLQGIEPVDVTIASAISTHLCDPHYFLRWIADHTRKMLLITTPLFQADGSYFFARQPIWRKERRLPYFYELVPTRKLLINMFRAGGFKDVYELMPQDNWPKNMRQTWGVFLVTRLAGMIGREVIENFNMELTPDYREECSDGSVVGVELSSPKSWSIKEELYTKGLVDTVIAKIWGT